MIRIKIMIIKMILKTRIIMVIINDTNSNDIYIYNYIYILYIIIYIYIYIFGFDCPTYPTRRSGNNIRNMFQGIKNALVTTKGICRGCSVLYMCSTS